MRVCVRLVVATALVGGALFPRTGEGSLEQMYSHRLEMLAVGGEAVILEYDEVQPGATPLSSNAIAFSLGIRNRQYYLDHDARVIRVLSSEGELPFEIRWDWLNPTQLTVSPEGNVYVWEATGVSRFYVFDPDGAFLEEALVDVPDAFRPREFVWLSEDELVIGGTSLEGGYYGFFGHRMKVDQGSGGTRFEHSGSFIETREFAPGLYNALAGGQLALDEDGGILFSASANHRVEKYSVAGTLEWTVEDPGVFPDAMDLVEVQANGYVRLTRVAGPVGFFAMGDWIVHFVLQPVEGLSSKTPSSREISQAVLPKTIELISRSDPTRRVLVNMDDDVLLMGADAEGRVYGIEEVLGRPRPIQGRISVRTTDRSEVDDGR